MLQKPETWVYLYWESLKFQSQNAKNAFRDFDERKRNLFLRLFFLHFSDVRLCATGNMFYRFNAAVSYYIKYIRAESAYHTYTNCKNIIEWWSSILRWQQMEF